MALAVICDLDLTLIDYHSQGRDEKVGYDILLNDHTLQKNHWDELLRNNKAREICYGIATYGYNKARAMEAQQLLGFNIPPNYAQAYMVNNNSDYLRLFDNPPSVAEEHAKIWERPMRTKWNDDLAGIDEYKKELQTKLASNALPLKVKSKIIHIINIIMMWNAQHPTNHIDQLLFLDDDAENGADLLANFKKVAECFSSAIQSQLTKVSIEIIDVLPSFGVANFDSFSKKVEQYFTEDSKPTGTPPSPTLTDLLAHSVFHIPIVPPAAAGPSATASTAETATPISSPKT